MDVIKNGSFEEFEAILKKMLEQFQDQEFKENVEVMFDKINFFHETKNEIEDYEKTINSHIRPLRLGFVGGFSTGKSSMINSLLGEEILGVKLEPATAQITELSYGEKFEVLEVTKSEDSYLYYKEISLEDYQKSSTTRVNKSKNLSHYIIKHPSKNLSRFTIVDTPGFSSTSKGDDELTKKWIETLDLLVWIFDANKVGDKTEYDKLKELGSSTKIIGVINKIDLKSPGVREKIRNEIRNEEFLDDVFFYSSKKVLDEFTKSKCFNDTLENITSEIKYCVINSEGFDINKNNSSEITFKTSTLIKPFSLVPLQTTSYTEYYDEFINKIDNVRENEINLILNQTLVNKHNDFRSFIKDELFHYQEIFNGDVSSYDNEIKETTDFLQKSEDLFKNIDEDFYEKLEVSFKVFYTAFFDELGDYMFYKHVDSGIFSDDVHICMIHVDEDQVKDNLYEFISNEFQSFLESSFAIYENIINHSVYKEFSKIEEIRNDEYHIINTIVDGLINSSVDSIIGYQRNFESYKTENFLQDKNFHKNNIDLVVPDELLKISICKLLIADLIDASVKYDFSLGEEIEELEFKKNDTLKILSMIEILLKKIN
jgi:hypothetical protein